MFAYDKRLFLQSGSYILKNISSSMWGRYKNTWNRFAKQEQKPGLGGAVGCASNSRPGGCGFDSRRGRQHSFVEIDYEIFSTVILSLPLIQEGQLSVSGEKMCTILVNRLKDLACPVNVWLGKLTALDMTTLGWPGRKTSTQTGAKPQARTTNNR